MDLGVMNRMCGKCVWRWIFRWLVIIGRYIGHQVGGWTEFGTVGRIGRGTFGIGCDPIGKRMERERTVINIFALCTIQYFWVNERLLGVSR